MKKLIILLILITTNYADDCIEHANHFKESIDDVKMAIQLNSKEEANYFVEEAYNFILDYSACIGKSKQKYIDVKEFRKVLNKQKNIVSFMHSNQK